MGRSGAARPGHLAGLSFALRFANARQQLERLANGPGFSSRDKSPSPAILRGSGLKFYEAGCRASFGHKIKPCKFAPILCERYMICESRLAPFATRGSARVT
jgi:hypothetical protein